MTKKINEEAIPAWQKKLNTNHAEGMPTGPGSKVGGKKPEPKSGVDQHKVDFGDGSSNKEVKAVTGQKKMDPSFQKQLQSKVDKEEERMDSAPEDVSRMMKAVNANLWKALQGMIDKIVTDNNSSTGTLHEAGKAKKKEDPKAKVRNKSKAIFDNADKKVKDNKDHFPINTVGRARNALARANQYAKVPKWYDGTIKELKKAVASAVKKAFPEIDVTEKATD